MSAPRIIAIIVAGGRGERLGPKIAKPLVRLGDRPLVAHSLQTFAGLALIHGLVLVCGPDWQDEARRLAKRWVPGKFIAIVPGGAERSDSVLAGLAALPESCAQVVIHDAARPFVPPDLIIATLKALATHHGAAPGLALSDTLRKVENSLSLGAADRSRFVLMQTPQCFHRHMLELAYRRALQDGFRGTDDVACVERLPAARIAILPGDPRNFKITTPEDLKRARLGVRKMKTSHSRIGEGFDAHRLVAGRPLILGGVHIPFEKGLLGHSDADVLCHAIGDALLGAAALGDLGAHFPDSAAAYKDASSLHLLGEIAKLLQAEGYEIINIDATLILECPKTASHRQAMITNIAKSLYTSPDRVSVKATTTEGMGFEGRGEGISCRAVACLKR